MKRARLYGPASEGGMELIPSDRRPQCTKCESTEIEREFCPNSQCAIFAATEKEHFHMKCVCGWQWPMESKEDPVKDPIRLFRRRECPKCLSDVDVDVCNNDCQIIDELAFKDGEIHLHMRCNTCKFRWFSWPADVANPPPVTEREAPVSEGTEKEARIVPEE